MNAPCGGVSAIVINGGEEIACKSVFLLLCEAWDNGDDDDDAEGGEMYVVVQRGDAFLEEVARGKGAVGNSDGSSSSSSSSSSSAAPCRRPSSPLVTFCLAAWTGEATGVANKLRRRP